MGGTPKLVAAGLVTNFKQVRSMRVDGTSGRNMSGRHLHVCELRNRRNNERVQRHRRLARGAWVSTQCWRGLLVRARPSGRRSARGRACFTCMHTLLESGNGRMHGIGSQGCCLLLVPVVVDRWRRHIIPRWAGGVTRNVTNPMGGRAGRGHTGIGRKTSAVPGNVGAAATGVRMPGCNGPRRDGSLPEARRSASGI